MLMISLCFILKGLECIGSLEGLLCSQIFGVSRNEGVEDLLNTLNGWKWIHSKSLTNNLKLSLIRALSCLFIYVLNNPEPNF